MDHCLIEQCNKQVSVFEMELLDVSSSIASIEDAKELPDEKLWISDANFSTGLKISKLFSSATEASTTPVREGICLPKIRILTFDGHILQWQSFWEQFELYAHNRAELSDAVKPAYLSDALKDRPPLNIIEGLAQCSVLFFTIQNSKNNDRKTRFCCIYIYRISAAN